MQLTGKQIDYINIGLILVSLCLAFALPFEVFLFSYAVLGPLHYLTEISWLHKKNYFVPAGEQKVSGALIFLIAAAVLCTLVYLAEHSDKFFGTSEGPVPKGWISNMMFIMLALAGILVVFKRNILRFAAIGILLSVSLLVNLDSQCVECTSKNDGQSVSMCTIDMREMRDFIVSECRVKADGSRQYDGVVKSAYTIAPVLLTLYLPTLVHVLAFTFLFMMFGALKSGSKVGVVAAWLLLVCAAMPFVLDVGWLKYQVTDYARSVYESTFMSLSQTIYSHLNIETDRVEDFVTSSIGVEFARFLAFIYTYHYLNWFSKTSLIQWHVMPKINMAVVLVVWAAAVSLYAIDYKLGLSTLFFLSLLHVFLELPLNYVSIIGIGSIMKSKVTGYKQRAEVTA